ncbi:salicylate 1-monooxygenase [Pseudomonas moorei]|uniref:Salicylate 1-monooxygenase n=1 Tax=Pseudomonas moorei TaxID=395599 RepID=A0A1H1ID33_9PSED|nr:salicylate 1-monooxygenase [Pseudomonas moorei]KAB0508998.1 salicylate 1-monooxygenase [Pseudomonas moorei]SDR35469.1 salicylate hydroxylase [Pseudomonas moorei]
MNSSPLRVAIVGGGIAGAALALGLSKAPHIHVKLFETASAFGEIGAGISFGVNAVEAINRLGVGNVYRDIADSTPAPWQDVWFEWRHADDASLIVATLAPGIGQSSIHRADFIDMLERRLPAGIASLGKHLLGYEENPDDVTLKFADGSTYTADVLIAADGIKSTIRNSVLTAAGHDRVDPRFTGTSAYRGLVETAVLREAFRAASLDEHLLNVPQMFLIEDGHVLTFPVKKGRLTNIVAFVSDRSVAEPEWPAGQPWVRNATTDEMLHRFDGAGSAVKTLLSSIKNPTLWALHDFDPLPTYVHGRVALIGDAAHAMLPHQGAGAGQGLEDAFFMTEVLSNPAHGVADVPRLLAAYDDTRRARASRVQLTSREAGDLYEYKTQGVGRDTSKLKFCLENRMDWIWKHDLGEEVQQAMKDTMREVHPSHS